MNINTKKESEPFARFITGFLKWAGIALLVGAVGGTVGALFYALVSGAAEFRGKYPNIIFLMPVGGLIIAHLYRINKMSDNGGTNQVISSVRDKDHPPVIIAPLIFGFHRHNKPCGRLGRKGRSFPAAWRKYRLCGGKALSA